MLRYVHSSYSYWLLQSFFFFSKGNCTQTNLQHDVARRRCDKMASDRFLRFLRWNVFVFEVNSSSIKMVPLKGFLWMKHSITCEISFMLDFCILSSNYFACFFQISPQILHRAILNFLCQSVIWYFTI